MTQKSMIVAMGLISALAVSPVLAQTNNTTSANRTDTTATSSGQSLTKPGPDQWLVSHLKGLDVYNDQNQKLGGIDELLANQQGQIQAVVLDVGGFLGVGVKHVAVPFSQLHFVNTPVNANGTANRTMAPASTAAIDTRGPNAPGNPTASTAGTGLGSNPTGMPNSAVNQTGTNGTLVANNKPANNRNPNVPDHAMLSMTQDQVKNAPTFNYNNP